MATTAKDKDEKKRNPTMLNRKARHEYALEETYVAGIALTGTEIKSVRLGLANLQDSFCRVQNGEVWVYNLYIAPYEQGNRYNVESRRQRKLLLHKWQITKITTRVNERGLSVIPTKMFFGGISTSSMRCFLRPRRGPACMGRSSLARLFCTALLLCPASSSQP